ncbi:hypothetical protein H6B14_13560 [Phocaeicola coprophilus]|nr:hypothetical protein [Phocaeicola coprophilus]
MARGKHIKKKEEQACVQLTDYQLQELARQIVSELERQTDISRGTLRNRKRLLPPPGATMVF